MSALAVSWFDGTQIHVVPLAPGVRVTVGRSPEADLQVDDSTVSRVHAALTPAPDRQTPAGHQIEHLGHTNPTLVNGAPIGASGALRDGDTITLGTIVVTFHDLAARDRLSGLVCHVCHRENDQGERDCWYCGTSLLNAPTTIRQQRPVLLRAVSGSGKWADLYAKQQIHLTADGGLEAVKADAQPGATSISMSDVGPVLAGPRAPSETGAGSTPLATGRPITIGDALFTVIVREERAAR